MNSMITSGNTSPDKSQNKPDLYKSSDGHHYNQMMDESKQTEEADISRSDFTETHSQDTLRNIQRLSEAKLLKGENLELRGRGLEKITNNYQNLNEEGDSDRIQSLNKNQRLKDLILDNNIHLNAYTQDEEEKTQDLIKNDLLDDQLEDLHNISPALQQKTRQSRRAITDEIDYDQQTNPNKSNQDRNQVIPKKSNKKKISTMSLKQTLPSFKLNVPLSVSTSEIFEVFTSISKAQRFQIIEMEQSLATAVNKEPFSIKKMFMRCIPFSDGKNSQQNDSFISAIRIQISVNEQKCCRKIHLKGLYGEITRLQEFSNSFKNKINEISEQAQIHSNRGGKLMTQAKKTSNNSLVNLSTAFNQRKQKGMKKGAQILQDDDSDQEAKYGTYNETSSIYQIHKILSSDQYTLGKNMEGIMELINDTVNQFQSQYNLGKDSAKSLMQYCRPSVEKYVFQKLYDKLFAMYACKNERDDMIFVERSSIIKKMKPFDVMLYLGIKEKFLIGDNLASITGRSSYLYSDQNKQYMSQQREIQSPFRQDIDSNNPLKESEMALYESNRTDTQSIVQSHLEHHFNLNNSSTSSSLGLGQINKVDLPYQEAIKQLEKIQSYQTPREKLQCLSESFQSLKTTIVDHYKGKFELSAMDDVLPLTIYTVAMADLSHIQSEFNIMEDFLSIYDRGFDFEKKLLTNLDVSIKYVNSEWEL
ncbi:UNKNOWN [Stylonychia lemnae]|uniref:VPS9 domain-containing protein n=1 Tax=Stylonychia lemnae TaxID=5949 RepID=A0A078A306_STYLE|nr:UNKNOWN [Stylonychia lemnae]|eukprot:CDW76663.1 UNKNOWN [Stylonychia lemnae]